MCLDAKLIESQSAVCNMSSRCPTDSVILIQFAEEAGEAEGLLDTLG